MSYEIQHIENGSKGIFYIEVDRDEFARMTYSRAGEEKIIIDHTEVGDDHKGEGLGKDLVFFAVDFARENNLKILPLCPFARVIFKRNKEAFKDVV